MGTIQTQIPPRQPMGPYPAGRACSSCGAHLKTTNPGPDCEPCLTPASELHAPDDPMLSELDRLRIGRELEALAEDERVAA